MARRGWCRVLASLRTLRPLTRASTSSHLPSSNPNPCTNSSGLFRHGNVTVLVLGSSIPGLNNLTSQAVPGCDAKAIASSSKSCNTTHVALSLFNPFSKKSKTGSLTLPNQTFQKNLFNDSFSCPQSGSVPAFNGDISVDVKSTVNGDIDYAVTLAGILSSLKSPSTAFSLVVGFDASLNGTLTLNADLIVSPHHRDQMWKLTMKLSLTLQGTLSTGDIPLFTIGLPGLDFGSALKIGPTFNIYAEADATIQTNLEMDVDLSYSLTGGQLVFPPSQGSSSGGNFSAGKSSTWSRGTVAEHLPI